MNRPILKLTLGKFDSKGDEGLFLGYSLYDDDNDVGSPKESSPWPMGS